MDKPSRISARRRLSSHADSPALRATTQCSTALLRAGHYRPHYAAAVQPTPTTRAGPRHGCARPSCPRRLATPTRRLRRPARSAPDLSYPKHATPTCLLAPARVRPRPAAPTTRLASPLAYARHADSPLPAAPTPRTPRGADFPPLLATARRSSWQDWPRLAPPTPQNGSRPLAPARIDSFRADYASRARSCRPDPRRHA